MPLGRDRRVEVSQGFPIVEPGALRHKTFDELEYAVGPIDEPAENLTCISVDGAVATFVKQPFGFRRALGRRQIEKRQEIARLVMGAGLLELSSSLGIDQGGRHIRKRVRRIAARRMALRFDEYRPTGFETAQGIVQTTGDGNEFGRNRAIEVRPPELCCPLKRPILVEDDPLINKSRPRQKIRETRIRASILR